MLAATSDDVMIRFIIPVLSCGASGLRFGDEGNLRPVGSDKQYQPDVIEYPPGFGVRLLNIAPLSGSEIGMKRMNIHMLALALTLCLSAPASAACYADYKAKRDNPLRLHYGVMEVPNAVCQDKSLARKDVAARLKPEGWTLLNVLSVFRKAGLEKRKESAGEYFLRY